MTEHKHEWKLKMCHDQKIAWFDCEWSNPEKKIWCFAQLNASQVEARLNATERLSAEDALAYCEVENHIWGFGIKEACSALRAYADALRADRG